MPDTALVSGSPSREETWEKGSLEHSSSSEENLHTTEVDRTVRRKVDLHLIPLIAILYLCSFLDRGNIGNARVAGMAVDLKLTGIKYQLAAAVFFIPYSLLEVPCNVVLKLVRPSVWIPSIMFAWGLVMVCMTFVNSFRGLVIARVFLGLTEAGLPPGVAFLITLWYRKADQARPISLYFSSATLSGAFGGLLAFAIQKLNGRASLHGWQWIFLLEGLATIIFSLLAFWKLPDYPSTAKFLTDKEREHLTDALARDTAGEPQQFERRFILETLKDPKSWLQTIIYLGMVMPLYATSLFLPTIINALGYSASTAQLMTIPPYAAGCLTTIAIGWLSDHYKVRGPFVMGLSFLGIIGYIMLYTTSPANLPGVGYAGSILAACGVFPTVPIMLAWGSANAGSSLKKAVMIGLLSGVGNLGGICSSFIYRTQDTPRFHLGHGIVIGFLGMAFMGSTFATYLYRRLNKEKEVRCTVEGIDPARAAELAYLGTESPLFRDIKLIPSLSQHVYRKFSFTALALMTRLASSEFLAEIKSIYPRTDGISYLDNPWYIVAAVAFCGSNEAEEVPHVFEYALQELQKTGASHEEQLSLARKFRDAIFKAGLTAGYPKSINSLIELQKVMPIDLQDTEPRRQLDTPIEEYVERGKHLFQTIYGSTAEQVQHTLDSIYPDMGWFSNTIGYGLTYGFMGVLTPIETSYTLVAALITSDSPRQIQWHLDGARRNGASFDEVKAVREISMRIASAVGIKWKAGVPEVKDTVL